MTIASIIIAILFGIVALGGAAWSICACENNTKKIAGAAVCIVIGAACIGGLVWSSGTEAGKRAYKDQQSNVSGGIERTVRVYDFEGDLIQEYTGKFDVETDDESYILFDDASGKRHIIYYTTGTIIIDEN
ncbi:hypothetical protein SDC9_169683 [bioreactor metagenome]|uniref:Uncharacterized protein n=1 Tax=bioreactor metagenome TaxID=1076179 RepID=A0A645G8I0_9ZZZZ